MWMPVFQDSFRMPKSSLRSSAYAYSRRSIHFPNRQHIHEPIRVDHFVFDSKRRNDKTIHRVEKRCANGIRRARKDRIDSRRSYGHCPAVGTAIQITASSCSATGVQVTAKFMRDTSAPSARESPSMVCQFAVVAAVAVLQSSKAFLAFPLGSAPQAKGNNQSFFRPHRAPLSDPRNPSIGRPTWQELSPQS